jgi:hypothetical protein
MMSYFPDQIPNVLSAFADAHLESGMHRIRQSIDSVLLELIPFLHQHYRIRVLRMPHRFSIGERSGELNQGLSFQHLDSCFRPMGWCEILLEESSTFANMGHNIFNHAGVSQHLLISLCIEWTLDSNQLGGESPLKSTPNHNACVVFRDGMEPSL